jgi:hypothetical protein
MVNRVVSTKLTEEEHSTLLEACNTEGRTPSSFIKSAILQRLKSAENAADELEELLLELNADNSSAKEKPQSVNPCKHESALMKLMRSHRTHSKIPST